MRRRQQVARSASLCNSLPLSSPLVELDPSHKDLVAGRSMTRPASHEWPRLHGTVGDAAPGVKQLSTNKVDRGMATAGGGCLPRTRLPVLAFQLDDVGTRPRAADDLG